MNDSGTARTAPVNIPPELVLAILNSVDKGRRVATLRNARLVSRSWSNLLLRSLYRDVSITLTEADDHNLDALCTFFVTHPDICGYVHSLTLYDKAAEVTRDRKNQDDNTEDEDEGKDEDEDAEEEGVGEEGDSESSDEDYDDGNEQTEDDYSDDGSDPQQYYHDNYFGDYATYRCSVDPDLLKRTLSHLPRLHDLRLQNILPRRAVTLDHGSAETKGIRVQNLRIIFPGWEHNSSPAMHLILYILGIFNEVCSVTVKGTFQDTSYVGIMEPTSTELIASRLRVQNLSLLNVHPSIPDRLAQESLSSAISTLEVGAGSGPYGLNKLLVVAKSRLQSLKCEIVETLDIGPLDVVDLSICNALNSLTLHFCLYTHYDDLHAAMVKHINKTLDSLTRRTRTAPALRHFVLHIMLREEEPGDSWPLAREEMRTMEDVLLELADAQACSSVHVRTDLQAWYAAEGYEVSMLGKSAEELDSRWSRYVVVCEEALRQAWPRLDERGVLEVSSAPVTLTEEDPDYPESY